MTTTTRTAHNIVSKEEWLEARKALLTAEKALTRRRDELSRHRRELPWVEVDKNYVFEGTGGKVSLADLFEGRSQLVIYHFMFGPEWKEGCPSCSFVADHMEGALIHLAHRDVSLAVVSRARIEQIEAFRRRMGWKFRWVSSYGTDFNWDYHVSFSKEELAGGKAYYNYAPNGFPSDEGPGISVFYKDEAGAIFHTYSAFARGVEPLVGTYNYLDLVPKGRDEDGLAFTMAWVRHHDRYDDQYKQPEKTATCCAEDQK